MWRIFKIIFMSIAVICLFICLPVLLILSIIPATLEARSWKEFKTHYRGFIINPFEKEFWLFVKDSMMGR